MKLHFFEGAPACTALGALLIIPCSIDTTKTYSVSESLSAEWLWDYFTLDGFTQNILTAVVADVFSTAFQQRQRLWNAHETDHPLWPKLTK